MKNTRVAFMFDFDGTLIDGFMQDYKLMELIKTNTEDFWKEIYAFAEEHNMDHNSAFLYKLIEVSKRNGVRLTREKLVECGKYMPFFKGVKEFFPRIKEYATSIGLDLEFYIISSGNKEIIEGSDIGGVFNRIFASEYVYNKNNEPIWIAHNVNYTVKTQFVNRIRKNLIDKLFDAVEINEYVSEKGKLIPYANLVYFGDGYTDVPSMKVVSMNGGNTICVYVPKDKEKAESQLENGRATYIALADYSNGSKLDQICKNILDEIALKNVR